VLHLTGPEGYGLHSAFLSSKNAAVLKDDKFYQSFPFPSVPIVPSSQRKALLDARTTAQGGDAEAASAYMKALWAEDDKDKTRMLEALPMVYGLADGFNAIRSYLTLVNAAIGDVLEASSKIPRADDLLPEWEAFTEEQRAEFSADFRVWANTKQVGAPHPVPLMQCLYIIFTLLDYRPRAYKFCRKSWGVCCCSKATTAPCSTRLCPSPVLQSRPSLLTTLASPTTNANDASSWPSTRSLRHGCSRPRHFLCLHSRTGYPRKTPAPSVFRSSCCPLLR
jgi:hypothetical protein